MSAHVEMSIQQTVSAADQACASWVIHCLRRYWYLCWVDDTLASWADMLLLRRYWYISWANTGLSLGGDIMLGRRYDTSVIPWLVGATSYLGDTHLGWRYIWGWYTSSYDYLGDTQLGWRYTSYTEAIWAIHILFTDLKACLQISVHAFEKVYVTQGPLSSLYSRLSHVRTLQQVNKQIIKHLHFIQRDCSLNNDNNAHGTIFYYKSACKFKGWFPPVFW